MNQDILEQWVEALYSEDYTQGQYALRRRDNTFCCLGVLCDLYVKEGHGQWKPYRYKYVLNDEEDILPTEVAEWAGLPTSPEVVKDGEMVPIVTLNDEQCRDFNEIADALLRTYSAP